MLDNAFKPLVQPLISEIQKFKARRKVNSLLSSPNLTMRAIGEALNEALEGAFSACEQQWIDSIEEYRSRLLKSRRELLVIDYGAGSANAKRSKEEMKKGVSLTTTVADVCSASKNLFWASVLFKLVRKLKPLSCVELGSCVGISASYLAAALKINGHGQLKSLEGSPAISEIAIATLNELALDNCAIITGPFHETLSRVLVAAQPIDFLFNDGHHDYDAVIRYFTASLPYLADEAIIVFDDISWSPGMRKAWAEIVDNDLVSAAIDLQTIGIVLVGKIVQPAKKD